MCRAPMSTRFYEILSEISNVQRQTSSPRPTREPEDLFIQLASIREHNLDKQRITFDTSAVVVPRLVSEQHPSETLAWQSARLEGMQA